MNKTLDKVSYSVEICNFFTLFSKVLIIFLLFSIPSISAYYGYSSSDFPSSILINETTTNVNNSQYLEGHPASYFYPYSNPYSFYNSTTLPNLNSTGLIKDWNATGLLKDWNNTGLIINWTIDTSNFYLKSNPFSFWNDTYATFNKTYADTLYAPSGAGNASWNQSLADTLYYSITNPYGFYNSSNFVITDYYLKSNPFGFYNVTTLPDLNSSGLIKDWNSTGLIINWSIDTSNFYLNSNPYGYYNITTAPIYINDTFAGNYSNYLSLFNWNKTYADTLYYSLSNPYGFYNSTTLNTTAYLVLNSTGLIKDWNSTGYIKDWNSTGYIKDWNSTGFIKNWSVDIDLLNATGLIKDWNSTGYIKDWNSTGLIANWTIDTSNFYTKDNPYGFYNVTTAPIYINDTFAGNYSTYLTLFNWNKTYADTLYYGLSNPYSYYNSTTIPAYYPLNNPYGYYNSTSFDINNYYLKSNPYSFYNSTTLTTNSQLLNGNAYWNNTYATFNKTYADTLYYSLSNPYSYYNITTAPTYINDTFGANYSTYLTLFNWNKTYADTLYANTTWAYNQTIPAINTILGFNYYNVTNAPIYLNDTFRGSNYSTFLTHIDWSKAVNGTLALNSSLSNYYLNSNPFGYYNSTSFNINDYYLKTNPYGYYNITTAPTYVNDTFSGNYSTFLTHITWANAINGTLALASSIPTNNNQLTNGNNYWNSTFATFNKTYADTLYYGIGNSYGYYNSSTIPSYMPSAYATNNTFYPYSSNPANYLTSFTELDPKAYNGTLAFNSSLSNYLLKTEWNATNTSYYLASNPSGYIDWSKAVNGTLALASSIPTNNNQLANGNNYWNNTFATFNKTYADTLYQVKGSYLTAETDPLWTANYSTYLTLFNWNKTYADTLYYPKNNPYGYYNSTSFDINNYYLKSNPYSYYNSTTIPAYLTAETNWNANYSTFLTHITWANVYNGTMAKVSDLVNYNSTGLIKDWNATGYIKNWDPNNYIKDWNSSGLIKDWWASSYNGTLAKTDSENTFAETQTFSKNITLGNNCLVNQTGGAYICFNGTGIIISGGA